MPSSLASTFASFMRLLFGYFLRVQSLVYAWFLSLPVINKLPLFTTRQADTDLSNESVQYDLPDVVLLRIFSQLAVGDLVATGYVCSRWKRLQTSALLARKSLTILIGHRPVKLMTVGSMLQLEDKDDMEAYLKQIDRSNPVYLRRLEEKTVRWLLAKFPRIEKLTISLHHTSSKVTRKVAFLLSKWSPTLTSLKLYLNFDSHSKEQKRIISSRMFYLLGAVNELPKVKVLTMELQNTFISFDHCSYVQKKRMQIDMPILGRLTEFNFYSSDHATFLFDSFRRYAMPNRQLKCIRLFNHIGRTNTWHKYFELDDMLLSRFKQIHLHIDQDNDRFTELIPRFTSVTHLKVYIECELTYREIIFNLAKMPQLTHLNIIINNNNFHLGVEDDAIDTLPQLTTVKQLTLDTLVCHHDDTNLENFMVNHVFPNLELLNVPFDIWECEACGLDSEELTYDDDAYNYQERFLLEIDDDNEATERFINFHRIKEKRAKCAAELIKPLAHITAPMKITFDWGYRTRDYKEPMSLEEVLLPSQ